MAKGEIEVKNKIIDLKFTASYLAQELAKEDALTQADFFVWFFNRLYFNSVDDYSEKIYDDKLLSLEKELDLVTRRRLKAWTDTFDKEGL